LKDETKIQEFEFRNESLVIFRDEFYPDRKEVEERI
jgi:hypothetical protein